MDVSRVYFDKLMEVARSLGAGDDEFVQQGLSLIARHMAITDYAGFSDGTAGDQAPRLHVVPTREVRCRRPHGNPDGHDRGSA